MNFVLTFGLFLQSQVRRMTVPFDVQEAAASLERVLHAHIVANFVGEIDNDLRINSRGVVIVLDPKVLGWTVQELDPVQYVHIHHSFPAVNGSC